MNFQSSFILVYEILNSTVNLYKKRMRPLSILL
nr:MAG TPA: hypothetical protein [Bacteriophage sp.]